MMTQRRLIPSPPPADTPTSYVSAVPTETEVPLQFVASYPTVREALARRSLLQLEPSAPGRLLVIYRRASGTIDRGDDPPRLGTILYGETSSQFDPELAPDNEITRGYDILSVIPPVLPKALTSFYDQYGQQGPPTDAGG
jgi:hypothetical protein